MKSGNTSHRSLDHCFPPLLPCSLRSRLFTVLIISLRVYIVLGSHHGQDAAGFLDVSTSWPEVVSYCDADAYPLGRAGMSVAVSAIG